MKLSIHHIIQETADTQSIHFNHPATGRLSYIAGQFLTLIFNINGKSVRRAYSLCSAPETDEFLSVAVKHIPCGEVSGYIANNLKAGMEVEVLEPMGNFVFRPGPGTRRHIVLFAAGSGITPLFGMMKSALASEPDSQVTLIYGNRHTDSIIFLKELTEWQAKYPLTLRVVHSLTNPPEKWYGATGRIAPGMLEEILDQVQPLLPVTDTLHYMCGPAEMMHGIEAVLTARGIRKDRILHESFFSSIDEAAKQIMIEEEGIKDREVTVIYGRDTIKFMVPAAQTILEAALDQDYELPYSCQSGLCTACRGKCLSGKVHMDETEGLSDSELNKGYVLTCVGRLLTDGVVIEIG